MKLLGRRRLASLLQVLALPAVCLLPIALFMATYPVMKARSGSNKPLRVVAALLPPHLDAQGGGREGAIIRAALDKGLKAKRPVEIHVLPFSKHWSAYQKDERFDAVATVPPVGVDLTGHSTGVYIQYQNGVGYRCADFPDGLGFDPLGKLVGKRVIAFAHAKEIIPDLPTRIPLFEEYHEEKDQRIHSDLLLRGEIDAVIADGGIFRYYTEDVMQALGVVGERYCFDPVGAETEFVMIFRRIGDRDAFRQGICSLSPSDPAYALHGYDCR